MPRVISGSRSDMAQSGVIWAIETPIVGGVTEQNKLLSTDTPSADGGEMKGESS